MKMKDILIFNNCPFECDQINEDMSSKFDNFFNTLENQHPYNTRGRKNNAVIKALSNSTTYGVNSDIHRAASEWNGITRTTNTIGKDNRISRTKFVKSLKEYLLI